jgi:hypothetical protein
MSLTPLITVLEVEGSNHKWEVGGTALGILLLLMLFLVIFGGGREHS